MEWIFGAVSGALVAALLLFFGYQALFAAARPAELVVVVERVTPAENGTMVAIVVANKGDEAASAVTVQAVRNGETDAARPREIQFDYIAPNAVRRGAFVFPMPVEASDVRVNVSGFARP